MADKQETYSKPSVVTAKDGDVQVDGPDGVDVSLTPEAAAETSERLLNGAMKAEGQRRMKDFPHQADDGSK
jgi:hypothetical protein